MATRDPQSAKAIPLQELIDLLVSLERESLPGVDAVKLARWLASKDGPTTTTLKAAGDAATVRALRETGLTAEALAVKLGYSHRARVTDAVLRHNRRSRGEL